MLRLIEVYFTKKHEREYIAISEYVARRVRRYWGVECEVITPPAGLIDYDSPKIERKEEYYLVVSPNGVQKYTKELNENLIKTQKEIRVVGRSSLSKRVLRKSNVAYLGHVSEQEKYKLIKEASGVIMGGYEDWGIVAVESMALGTPVYTHFESGTAEILNRYGMKVYKDPTVLFNSLGELKRVGGKLSKKIAEENSPDMFIENFKRLLY